MSKFLICVSALLLLSGSNCSESNTVGASYGPFHIKSIRDIVIEPLDCSVGPDTPAISNITMAATGAHVCTNKSQCGGDYLELFEFELEIPHIFSEDDDPERPEFYACGTVIEGTVIGTSDQGVETTIGSLSVPQGQDVGCAIFVDVQQLQLVTDPRLRITVRNSGSLLEHEDYAPQQVVAEQAVVCQ